MSTLRRWSGSNDIGSNRKFNRKKQEKQSEIYRFGLRAARRLMPSVQVVFESILVDHWAPGVLKERRYWNTLFHLLMGAHQINNCHQATGLLGVFCQYSVFARITGAWKIDNFFLHFFHFLYYYLWLIKDPWKSVVVIICAWASIAAAASAFVIYLLFYDASSFFPSALQFVSPAAESTCPHVTRLSLIRGLKFSACFIYLKMKCNLQPHSMPPTCRKFWRGWWITLTRIRMAQSTTMSSLWHSSQCTQRATNQLHESYHMQLVWSIC